ncbi:thioredoxin reductase [Candidatus Peregrinibacteria bacterium CG11_big_fil_rev_8_21_14_0_20_49_14]|nr:MAG: thioredoxin reductase [Candidatus Peregrinibacteria bacterium CG11_big_fil_rev_8_21_14_0_20_49_14]
MAGSNFLSMKDVAIVGLGCAAYTAAIYTARYKLETLVVGAEEGGMGMTAAEVGNWPGEIEITGPDLMEKFKNHAVSYEQVEHKIARIDTVEKIDGGFRLTYQSGETAEARTVIFATGSNKRHLGIPGEHEFAGKGVTYCATCDAFFYRGKDVAVIGGGDSAVEGAAIAAQVANKVYLVHRRDEFRAEPYWVEKVNEKNNVEFVLSRNVLEVLGDGKVTGLKLDAKYNDSDILKVDGVFIEVGSTPATALPLQLGCEIDDKKHLKVGANMATSVPGVFGAGDLTSGSNHFAQFATAAGEGCVAANSVFNFLQSGK